MSHWRFRKKDFSTKWCRAGTAYWASRRSTKRVRGARRRENGRCRKEGEVNNEEESTEAYFATPETGKKAVK